MRTVGTIAVASFREAIRDRILYTIFFFALLMMGSSHVVESLVISQKAKIVKDMGLAAISILGLLTSVTVGANIFFKEIKRLSFYPLLSKPVSRGHILVGKYVGALLTLIVMIVLMGSILMLNSAALEGKFDPYLSAGLGMMLMEFSVITAFALLFSTFCAPTLSGLLTVAIYVFGHSAGLLKDVLSVRSHALDKLISGLFWLLPDLEKFNLKADVVYHALPSLQYLMFLVLNGVIYVCTALFLAWLVIRKRDMK